jgi:hypothetical protein
MSVKEAWAVDPDMMNRDPNNLNDQLKVCNNIWLYPDLKVSGGEIQE